MSSRGRSRKKNITGATEAKWRRRSTPEPSERVVLPSVTDGSTQGITVTRLLLSRKFLTFQKF